MESAPPQRRFTFLESYPINNNPDGVAAGLFQASRKGVTSEEGTARAIELATSQFSTRARRFSTACLSQLSSAQLTPVADQLIRVLRNDPDPTVRMFCATALEKSA